MLFKLTNLKMSRTTHCGVLEFVADENKVYLPYWVRIWIQNASKKQIKLYFRCDLHALSR